MKEWGEWEHNVRRVFEKFGICQKADTDHIVEQLIALSQKQSSHSIHNRVPTSSVRPLPQLTDDEANQMSWIAQAMLNTQQLPLSYYQGAINILKTSKQV